MIKLVKEQILNWVDSKDRVCNETFTRRVSFLGIPLHKKVVIIKHENYVSADDSSKKDIGFGINK